MWAMKFTTHVSLDQYYLSIRVVIFVDDRIRTVIFVDSRERGEGVHRGGRLPLGLERDQALGLHPERESSLLTPYWPGSTVSS